MNTQTFTHPLLTGDSSNKRSRVGFVSHNSEEFDSSMSSRRWFPAKCDVERRRSSCFPRGRSEGGVSGVVSVLLERASGFRTQGHVLATSPRSVDAVPHRAMTPQWMCSPLANALLCLKCKLCFGGSCSFIAAVSSGVFTCVGLLLRAGGGGGGCTYF